MILYFVIWYTHIHEIQNHTTYFFITYDINVKFEWRYYLGIHQHGFKIKIKQEFSEITKMADESWLGTSGDGLSSIIKRKGHIDRVTQFVL